MAVYTPVTGSIGVYIGPPCHVCGGDRYYVSHGPDDADVECCGCVHSEWALEAERDELEAQGFYDEAGV